MSKKKKEVEDPNNTWNMQLAHALTQTPIPALLQPPAVTATTTPRLIEGISLTALDAMLAADAAFTLQHASSREWDSLRSSAKTFALHMLSPMEALLAKGADINHYALMDCPFAVSVSAATSGVGAGGGGSANAQGLGTTPVGGAAAPGTTGGAPAPALTSPRTTRIWVTPLQRLLLRMVSLCVSWLSHGSTASNAASAFMLLSAARDLALWMCVKHGALLMTAPVFAEGSTSAPPPSAISQSQFDLLPQNEKQIRVASDSSYPMLGSFLTLCTLGDQPLLLERLASIVTCVQPTAALLATPSVFLQLPFTTLWDTTQAPFSINRSNHNQDTRLGGDGGDGEENIFLTPLARFVKRNGFELLDSMHAALVQFDYEAMLATLQSKRVPPPPPAPAPLYATDEARVTVMENTIQPQFDVDAVLATVAAPLAPLTAGHVALVLMRPEATRCLLLHGANVPFSLPVSAPGLTPLARACAVNDAASVLGLLNCGDLAAQCVTDSGGRHGHTLVQLALAPAGPPPAANANPANPAAPAAAAAAATTTNPPFHADVLDALLERFPAGIHAPNADGEPPLVLLIKTRGILPSFTQKWSLPAHAMHVPGGRPGSAMSGGHTGSVPGTAAGHAPSPATAAAAAAPPGTAGAAATGAAPNTTNLVMSNTLYDLMDVLLSRGANPNLPDGLGMTPLMHAVTAFLPDVVKKLLSLPPPEGSPATVLRAVDVSAKDAWGGTALHYAAALAPARGKGMTELLLQVEGIDVNAADGNGQTALHRAAIRGREQQTSVLLQHPSCDVNATDAHGNTALHRAVLHRKKDTVLVLLRRCMDDFFAVYGAGAAAGAVGKDGKPLAKAGAASGAKGGAKGAAAAVVPDGTPSTKLDIDLVNHEGQTALQLAVTQVRDTELAALLLQNGATVNRSGDRGGTLLHSAVWGESPEMAALLLANGADVTLRDEADETPLHVACRMGSVDLAKLLLAHGADPHDVGACHVRTPLHYAAESYHADLIDLLLTGHQPSEAGDGHQPLQAQGSTAEEGVHAHHHHQPPQRHGSSRASWVPDGRGRTALHLLCTENEVGLTHTANRLRASGSIPTSPLSSPTSSVATLSPAAAHNNNSSKDMTRSGTPSPTSSHNPQGKHKGSESVLQERIALERLRAARLLLEDGAPVDATDAAGWLPLHCAASVPSLTAIVELLLEKDPSLMVFRDNRGWTPLHCAVVSGAVETVEWLLKEMPKRGVSQEEQLRRVDALDRGPMLLAAEFGQIACAKVLIRASRGLVV